MPQNKEVPENLLSLLKSHIPHQDDDFLIGFCSCLSYQYPDSEFVNFFNCSFHTDLTGCFHIILSEYLNSGTFAPPSLESDVEGEGNQ